jgi:hypothetical protein
MEVDHDLYAVPECLEPITKKVSLPLQCDGI